VAQIVKVREGQRYAQNFGSRIRPSVWKVGSIYAGPVPYPHACLVDVEDPLHVKTISCTTLTDKVHYELVKDSA
jgi:hypothetical protein